MYIVAKENHQDGSVHWHCTAKYTDIIDSTDPHYFDYLGIHPNLIKGNPGKPWDAYITKDFEYVTNYYNACVWSEALSMNSVTEAVDFLWKKQPKQMCLSAHIVTENIAKRMRPEHPQLRYFGPYPKHFYPVNWNRDRFSLLISGPPGIGKTQFARYLLGENDYIKSSLEGLRRLLFDKPIIFDEVSMLSSDEQQSKEVTDVENGGAITMRYKDVEIPPGVPRIFLSNHSFPFHNPDHAVILPDGTPRRLHVHSLA